MIVVAKPWVGTAEARAVKETLLSGWVTQGPQVASFEKEFADYVGAPYACAVSSCTTALHLALRAVGVTPGSEVITVSHSFIATANAVRYCGATPVFVDIEPRTFNMKPSRIAAAIGSKTKAILAVHQLGMPCDMKHILAVARKYKLLVVEDAACAIGSQIKINKRWERIGKPHGDIACFSFHPRKLLTTGDGGMCTTANPSYDKMIRLWRQHGMSVPDTQRHNATRVIFEQYLELGYNYRLTDIQAAVGREQLKRMDKMIRRRRAQVARYQRELADLPALTLPQEPTWAQSNWQSYCVRLRNEGRHKGLQSIVMQTLLDAGISTRRGVMCSHREKAYAGSVWRCASKRCDHKKGHCTQLLESEQAQDQCVILPLYHTLTAQQQCQVIRELRNILD